MNVSEILEQKYEEWQQIEKEINALIEDRMYADNGSQIDHRILLADDKRRDIEDTIRHLTFMGPVATPEMQAEHRAQQWYKREHDRAMKRKALVEKALGEQK